MKNKITVLNPDDPKRMVSVGSTGSPGASGNIIHLTVDDPKGCVIWDTPNAVEKYYDCRIPVPRAYPLRPKRKIVPTRKRK
jgi:hypothetical protein